jgi:hypothetical protein
MANSSPVYDPETDSGGEPTYRTPPDLGPGHSQASGNPRDPRGDLRRAENQESGTGSSGGGNFKMGSDGGDGSSGSGSDDNFNFNPKGDEGGGSGAVGAAGLAARELAFGGGVAGAATSALGGAKNLFLGSKRRKQASLGGGLVGFLVVGLIVILGAASGPAQLVHLSHILQRSLGNSQNASSNRMDKLYRYSTANDIGETRIGAVKRSIIRPQLEELSNLGIDFDLHQVAGINDTTIDTDKLATKYPQLKDIPEAERGDWLANNTFSDVAAAGGEFQHVGGSVYKIDRANTELKSLDFDKITSTDALGALSDGGILSGLKLRVMSDYLGIPSLFHPLSKAAAQKLRDEIDAAKEKSTTETEEEAVETDEGADLKNVESSNGADDAAKSIEDDSSSLKDNAVNSLAVFGGACYAKSVAGDINTVNRARIALPAVVEALHFMAVGEQIENGKDVDGTQVEAIGKSLTSSSGEAVWSAQALQALGGNANKSGSSLSPDYRQAFKGSGIAGTIKSWADGILAAFPIPNAIGGPCGPAGIGIQIGGTIAASIASVIGEIGSFGALTPGIVAAWTAEQGASFAETATAMHFVQSFVLSGTTSATLAKDAFSGPLGGNLLAYGARYGADIGGAAEGLVPLANSNSTTTSYEQDKQSQQQFASEGLFARLFNIDDSRSLTGHLADSVTPGLTTNLADSVTNVGGLGHSFLSNLSSMFLPKSLADSSAYDWGFPQYGLPSDLANTTDPSMANPYTNADDVATSLDACSDNGANPSNCPMVKKASACFGVDVNQTQDDSGKNVWDVTPKQAVDMTADDYQSQDCGNDSNPNWQRMILFVLDTQTAKAAACWTGDDQSCQGIGYGSQAPTTGSPGAPPPTTTTAGATIDMDHLYDSSVSVACAPNTKDIGVYDGYTNGNPVKIRLCALSNLPSTGEEAQGHYGVTGADGQCPVNSRVSGAFYALVQSAKEAGIPMASNSCFRTMAHQQVLWNDDPDPTYVARPGTSNHQMGLAIDFTMADASRFNDTSGTCVDVGGRCEAPGDKVWEWLDKNSTNFDIKPYVNEYWHWSPTGN